MRAFSLALFAVLGYVWFAIMSALAALILVFNILSPFDWVPVPLAPVIVCCIGIPGFIIGLASSRALIKLRRAAEPRGFEPIIKK